MHHNSPMGIKIQEIKKIDDYAWPPNFDIHFIFSTCIHQAKDSFKSFFFISKFIASFLLYTCMKRNNCLYFFINTSSVLSLTEFLLGFFFISNFNNNLFIILFVQTKCHRCQSGKGSTASEYEKVFILLYIYKSYL